MSYSFLRCQTIIALRIRRNTVVSVAPLSQGHSPRPTPPDVFAELLNIIAKGIADNKFENTLFSSAPAKKLSSKRTLSVDIPLTPLQSQRVVSVSQLFDNTDYIFSAQDNFLSSDPFSKRPSSRVSTPFASHPRAIVPARDLYRPLVRGSDPELPSSKMRLEDVPMKMSYAESENQLCSCGTAHSHSEKCRSHFVDGFPEERTRHVLRGFDADLGEPVIFRLQSSEAVGPVHEIHESDFPSDESAIFSDSVHTVNNLNEHSTKIQGDMKIIQSIRGRDTTLRVCAKNWQNLPSFLHVGLMCRTKDISHLAEMAFCKFAKNDKYGPISPAAVKLMLRYYAMQNNIDGLLSVVNLSDKVDPLYKVAMLSLYAGRNGVKDVRSAIEEQCEKLMILEGIRLVKSEFSPMYRRLPTGYSCKLVDDQRRNHVPRRFKSTDVHQTLFANVETRENLLRFFDEQLKIEELGEVVVQSVAPKALLQAHNPARFADYYQYLKKLLTEKFYCNERDTFLRKNDPHSKLLEPFLHCLPEADFADLMVKEVQQRLCRMVAGYSEPYSFICLKLGERVMRRFHAKEKHRLGITAKLRKMYEDYLNYFEGFDKYESITQREHWLALAESHNVYPYLGSDFPIWPRDVKEKVGEFLYSRIEEHVRWNKANPINSDGGVRVFIKDYNYLSDSGHRSRVLRVDSDFARWMQDAAQKEFYFEPFQTPMICQPLPWLTVDMGCTFIAPTDYVHRLHNDAGIIHKHSASVPNEQLYPIHDALNQLMSIPWAVNEKVLDVVLTIFRRSTGDKRLSIPAHKSTFDEELRILKEKLKQLELLADAAAKQSDSVAAKNVVDKTPTNESAHVSEQQKDNAHLKKELWEKIRAVEKTQNEENSLWWSMLYKLSIAAHFRKHSMWFPMTMDFRGRVYPVPPYLSHIGDDISRGLMQFAQAQPLGPRGLDWLKIHCINLTKHKKETTIQERLNFANKYLPEILDSAKDPFKHEWWRSEIVDEPFQVLACCIEISNALSYPEGPENYPCRYPVHQDGSCNGLQHYAAMGRDERGGASVNLCPLDRPRDVYTDVLNVVNEKRAKDAAENSGPTSQLAKDLEPYMVRQVVKRTVMTFCYGVTMHGARRQIGGVLTDMGFDTKFSKEHLRAAKSYLAKKVFDSKGEVFRSATEMQKWLENASKFMTKAGHFTQWVTPLGLPVIQPYKQERKDTVFRVHPRTERRWDAVDSRRQRNGVAPNFVHSLDGTHMVLTSLFCQREGITFASVHDCFWTHPNTVEIMNRICREQFVRLHEEPILENLRDQIIKLCSSPDSHRDLKKADAAQVEYGTLQLAQIPAKGDLDLNGVKDSVYFFC